MKRDCSTCICKEGSCYPSTTIFDKDKTCKSYDPDYEGYIADLEKENAELKSLKDVADLIRLNNSHIVAMAQLNNNNVVLRKENAELKEKYVKNITDCDICDTYCNSQLTKAKELLKRYVPYRQITDSKAYKDLAEETEQFLNSEVEK